MSEGLIFGCYDKSQYGSKELSNLGCSNNSQVEILHENSGKHEFSLRIGHFAHFDPLSGANVLSIFRD